MRCPSGHENRADAAFCIECGARLVVACPQCSRELPPSARFCDGCGAGVAREGGEPAPRPAAYVPPPHLAEKIMRDRAQLEGERRSVTVLFIDAVASTSAGDKLNPEDLHRITQTCTEKMIDAVNRFEGTVTQFRGDGIMALFGAPIAHEDSARRGVSAALAMREALTEYASEVRAQGIAGFAYRIGIHTGPVIVGRIGADFTMDYTAIGDTVNLAARMEQWAPPNRIYITDATRKLVEGFFELSDLGLLEVKGKGEAVRAYEVLHERAARTRLEASVERGLTPYVGRDEHLETLHGYFRRAREREGQVVFVAGEAGMGKSRLLFEFHRVLQDEAAWLEGRCLSWGMNFPFLPILDIVRQVFQLDDGDDEQTTLSRIDELTRGWQSPPAGVIAHLRYLLGVDPGDRGVETEDPQMRRAAILEALRSMLVEQTRDRPVVVVIEDLHWIDEQSEEAIGALVDIIASLPVLMVVTLRPGFAHKLGDRTYYNRLTLRNLEATHSATMVEGVLQATGVPPQLCDMIVEKAEGNPFFIEEVTRALIDSGVLRRSEAGYHLARPVAEVQIPNTIEEVILSRLDRLQRSSRDVVQRAAVIGREFPMRLLARIADGGATIDSELGELKSFELIYEKSHTPELSYIFKHALTQEVALSTLLAERRKALHRSVAAAIEDLYADRLPDHYEPLAYHCSQGEEWQKAFDYSMRVAERARRIFAPRAAIEHLSNALKAAAHLNVEPDPAIYRARGLAYEAVGDFDRARADHDTAMRLARAQDDVTAEWQAHIDLGMLWAGRDYNQTGEYVTRAYEIARQTEDRRLVALSLNRLGNWRLNVDQPVGGLRDIEEAYAILRDLDDVQGVAESRDFLAMAYSLNSDSPRALDVGLLAEQHYRADDNKTGLSSVMGLMAFLGPSREVTTTPVLVDLHRARRWTDEAIALARASGSRSAIAFATFTRSILYGAIGEYQAAFDDVQEGIAIAREIEHRQWLGSGILVYGLMLSDIHSDAASRKYLEEGTRFAEELHSGHWINCAIAHSASSCVAFGDLAGAEAAIASVPPDLTMISLSQREVWASIAQVRLLQGRDEEALDIVTRLVEAISDPSQRDLARIPYLAWTHARACISLGRLDDAERPLIPAIDEALDKHMRPIAWRLLATLGDLREQQGRPHDAAEARARSAAIVRALADTIPRDDLRMEFLQSEGVRALTASIPRSGAL